MVARALQMAVWGNLQQEDLRRAQQNGAQRGAGLGGALQDSGINLMPVAAHLHIGGERRAVAAMQNGAAGRAPSSPMMPISTSAPGSVDDTTEAMPLSRKIDGLDAAVGQFQLGAAGAGKTGCRCGTRRARSSAAKAVRSRLRKMECVRRRHSSTRIGARARIASLSAVRALKGMRTISHCIPLPVTNLGPNSTIPAMSYVRKPRSVPGAVLRNAAVQAGKASLTHCQSLADLFARYPMVPLVWATERAINVAILFSHPGGRHSYARR